MNEYVINGVHTFKNTDNDNYIQIGSETIDATGTIINPKYLSAMVSNSVNPLDFNVVNAVSIASDTTAPDYTITLQSAPAGVGSIFGLDYESTTNEDFIIQSASSGSIRYRQVGGTTQELVINPTEIQLSDTTNSLTNTITNTTVHIVGASNNILLESSVGKIQSLDNGGYFCEIEPNTVRFNRPSTDTLELTDQLVAYTYGYGNISATWSDIINVANTGTVTPPLDQVLSVGSTGSIGQTITLQGSGATTTYEGFQISSDADYNVICNGGDVLTLGCAGVNQYIWRTGASPNGYLYEFGSANIGMALNSLKIGDADYKPNGITYSGVATTIENTNDAMTINGDDTLNLSSTNGDINITTPNGIIKSDPITIDNAGSYTVYGFQSLTSNGDYSVNTGNDSFYVNSQDQIRLASGSTLTLQGDTTNINGSSSMSITTSSNNINITAHDTLNLTATNDNMALSALKKITVVARDTNGDGYGIEIDKLTPNIYYHLNTSNAGDILTIDNTGVIKTQIGTSNTTINAGSESIQQSVSGYTTTPILELNNAFATAGNTTGVPSIKYNKSGRNAVAGDVIGSQHFYGKNYAGTSTEFANIEASVRNTGVGNDDGSIAFSGLINGTMTEFFRINGADSENNMFLPLDMNAQTIKSSTGNLNLSASGSTGTGSISLTTKNGVAGSGGGLLLTGNTLLSGSSGGSSGQHLCLTIGGTVYKIALLNP